METNELTNDELTEAIVINCKFLAKGNSLDEAWEYEHRKWHALESEYCRRCNDQTIAYDEAIIERLQNAYDVLGDRGHCPQHFEVL